MIFNSCECTASRTVSRSTRSISPIITDSSRPTTSRTVSSRSSAICAVSFADDPVARFSGTRSRARSRFAFSSSSLSRRHFAHARRCRSRWHSVSPHTRWRSPARRFGWNHRRQIRHGRLRVIPQRRSPWCAYRVSRRNPPPTPADPRSAAAAINPHPDRVWQPETRTAGGSLLTSRGGSFLTSVEVRRSRQTLRRQQQICERDQAVADATISGLQRALADLRGLAQRHPSPPRSTLGDFAGLDLDPVLCMPSKRSWQGLAMGRRAREMSDMLSKRCQAAVAYRAGTR